MNQYLFLYVLAFIWIVFAIIQDFRTREVSNWLNFSLIGFVLAYRAFYAIVFSDLTFFLYGFLGVLLFVALGYGLYYSRAFAGGDAKLLMGLGGIWPYGSYENILFFGVGFVLVLFAVGAVYSLIYSFFLTRKNWNDFKNDFKKQFFKYELFFFACIFLAVIFQAVIWFYPSDIFGIVSVFLVLLPLLFIYAKSVEECCMIKEVEPMKLREGDWLESDIKVGNRTIKKSVHGLSETEIMFLRKHNKKVMIKDGIPFTPAFLFALVFMVFALKFL